MIERKAYYNTGHCPNNSVPETHERGDFVTDERGCSRYIVEKSWVEYLPCGETRYEEFDNYEIPDGIDPAARRVKCIRCGTHYWLFPRYNFKQGIAIESICKKASI